MDFRIETDSMGQIQVPSTSTMALKPQDHL